MSQGQSGVLHTKSSYAPTIPSLPKGSVEDVKVKQLENRINILKNKENAFANKFGCENLEEFIREIRKVLNGNPNDLNALRQFSSINLRKHLSQFKQKYGKALEGQNIILRFSTDKSLSQIRKIFEASGGNGSISWTMSGDVEFNISWNVSAVKSIINKMKGKQFKTASSNIEALISYVESQADTLIDINTNQGRQDIQDFLVENISSPFALRKTDINNLSQNNPQLLKDFQSKIEDFIIKELCIGGSNDFISAVNTVLKQKNQNLTDLSFFMGGNAWVTQAVGSLGELQTAIFFQYISNKTSNKILSAQLSNIIGDNLSKYNQYYHTDIEILKEFGIQVKNYSGAKNREGELRTITVNLHPGEIASLKGGEGIVDYMVNSYFNTDIKKFNENDLSDFFKSHADELLNLDFSPEIPDQVSFYMIGLNLIPGSAILEGAFQKKTIEVSTSIHGEEKGSDNTFNTEAWHAPFHEWWKSTIYPPKKGQFEPTEKNNILAWEGKVSISTRFTYSALFDGTYRLF